MNVIGLKKFKSLIIVLCTLILVLIFMHPLVLYILLRVDYKYTYGFISGVAYATEGESGTEYSFFVNHKKYKGESNRNTERFMKINDTVLVIYYPNFPYFNTLGNSEFDPR